MMITKMIGVVALLAASAVANADTWINAGAVSAHSQSGFNALNSGFGIEQSITENTRMGMGRYNNSEWTRSNYAVIEYTPIEVLGWHAGAMAGYVDGYRHDSGLFTVPTAIKNWDRWGMRVIAAPGFDGMVSVLAVQIRLKIK